MNNPVGSIRGQVILRINGKDLNLGDISVAIDAKVLPRAMGTEHLINAHGQVAA